MITICTNHVELFLCIENYYYETILQFYMHNFRYINCLVV